MTTEKTMTKHMTGTREKWHAARLELLKAEKELTRRSDELAQLRQELPWVRIPSPSLWPSSMAWKKAKRRFSLIQCPNPSPRAGATA